MEIIIHGTKGGRKIFTPKKLAGLLDVTADGAKVSAIGQEVYAIRFTAEYAIFSKYKIIRDKQGDKRTGFVGFSLFLTNNEHLSGIDIITLLYKISDKYCREYIVDNNLDNVNEKWNFITDISNEYRSKLKSNDEEMQFGSKDDAFIYYKDDSELQHYFDVPYQEEYTPYRQVLFVEKALQGKAENPLNALRHSGKDLTGLIDLEKYRLYYEYKDSDGISIEVNVRGNKKYNKDWISRRRDELNIIYSKKYYKDKIITDNIDKIDKQFVQIDEMNRKVTVCYFSGLEPEIKMIRFDIKDEEGKPINHARINCQTSNGVMINGNEVTFKGNAIGSEWKIGIDAGSEYKSDKISIIPKDLSGTYPITLKAQKIVNFQAIDAENGDAIHDFILEIDRRKEQTNQIFFCGKDIHKSWRINIEANSYSSDSKKIVPSEENHPVVFKLTRNHPIPPQSETTVEIKLFAGKNGTLLKKKKREKEVKFTSFPSNIEQNMQNNEIEPKANFGYKYAGLKNETGQYIAQFKPILSLKQGIIAVLSLIVIVVTAWFYFGKNDKQSQPKLDNTQTTINEYINGNEFLSEKLKQDSTNWEQKKPKIDTVYNSVWYNPMTWSSADKKDSAEYKKWEEVSQSIGNAIKKRNLIDDKKFAELKSQNDFPKHQEFDSIVEKIDSSNEEKVKQKLGDISKSTLTTIADSIKNILKENAGENPSPSSTNNDTGKNPSKNGEGRDFIAELRGDKINLQKLSEYSGKDNFSKYKKSICLYKRFFELIKKADNPKDQFTNLLNDIKKDDVMKDSELMKFLIFICKDSKTFEDLYRKKIDKISKQDRDKISSLSELKNKIKI